MFGLAAWNASAMAFWLVISWGSPQIEYLIVAGGPLYAAGVEAAEAPGDAGAAEVAALGAAAEAAVDAPVVGVVEPPHAATTIATKAVRSAAP